MENGFFIAIILSKLEVLLYRFEIVLVEEKVTYVWYIWYKDYKQAFY